jgi:hypothetical protein
MQASYTKMHCMFGEREETPLGAAVNETIAWLASHLGDLAPKKGALELELMSLRPAAAVAAGAAAAAGGSHPAG